MSCCNNRIDAGKKKAVYKGSIVAGIGNVSPTKSILTNK